MDIKIRRFEVGESASIVKLEVLADKEFGEWNPAPEEYFEEAINRDRDIIWVAELDGEIIGYVEGDFLRKNEVDIIHLFVLKEHRNQGIEESLVKTFLETFSSRGFGKIYAIGARKWETELYKRFGFGTISYNMKMKS